MTPSIPNGTTRAAQVFLVDDHPITRAGLAAQLARHPDLQLCGEAEDVPEALQRIGTLRVDIVIVDLSLKSGSGIDLVKRLKARDSALRILVWSMHPEHLYAERSLRAGALGYVHKGSAPEQIIQAIRSVLAGKVYLSDDLAFKVLQQVIAGDNGKTQQSPVETLTDRELETFELLGSGLTTQAIAKKMRVSPKTVETYRTRIKEKLHLSNATQLIQQAAQWVLEKS